MTVLAAALCTACRRLICFWGSPRQKAIAVVKLWQNQTDSNAACSFVGDVWTDFTQRSDVEKARSDNCWDMLFHGKLRVQSYSKCFHHVGERNGRFANWKAVNRDSFSSRWWPTEEYFSFFAHWVSICFSSSIFLSVDSTTQHFSTHSAQTQVQLVGTSTVRNRRQKSDSLCRTYQYGLPTV